jgi:hypothetical protein
LLIGAAALCLQCGARSRGNDFGERSKVDLSPIRFDGEGLALRRCSLDDECPADLCTTRQCSEGFCVEAISVTCPSHPNPCLANECQPETGECEAVNATPDEDGDGFYAPRPGFLPGEPLACGDDCDDSHPDSFPSGTEVCDGHDNDCDGSIDEGFSFLPPDAQAVLISDGAKEAGLGGLVHDGELFVLSYSRRDERNGSILRGMREARDVEFSSDVALTNSDSYAGPVRFTGSQLVTAWEDRREEDFEVFYNRFDRAGNKLGPDLRLSVAQDFSINPTIAVVGETHAVLWQDRRDAWLDFQIYGQRVGEKGELIGDNVHLSPSSSGWCSTPSSAAARSSSAP